MARPIGWHSPRILAQAQAVLASDFISFREFQKRANLNHVTGKRYLDFLIAGGKVEMARQGSGKTAKRLYRLRVI